MTTVVSSPVFSDGDEIPQGFTCDGDDVSPPLGGQARRNDDGRGCPAGGTS